MKDLRELAISGMTEYKGRIITLSNSMVQLPDKSISFREIAHVKDAVCIVALKGENVLLVRQFRFAIGMELLELPAGRIDPDEFPVQAAQRELREETGYKGTLTHLGSFYSSPGFTSEKIHMYLATDLVQEGPSEALELDEGEFLQVEEMSWQEALSWAASGRFADGKTTLALLRARDYQRQLVNNKRREKK